MKAPEFVLGEMTCVSALGHGAGETFENLVAGCAPGMKLLKGDIPSRDIWFGEVPGELPPPAFGPDMRAHRLVEAALAASRGRFEAALRRHAPGRVAAVIGVSNTRVHEFQKLIDLAFDGAPVPAGADFGMIDLGTPVKYLARRLGIEGPAYAISTACSSAAKAFCAAARILKSGLVDAVVTGGVDARCRFAANGFEALGALSAGRCRPLAPDRDGINLGEAASFMLMERKVPGGGREVYFAGGGETSDAYHATAPDPEGVGAESAMRAALAGAGLSPDDVDYVNLHGTGTFANDAMEMKAVGRVFGERPRARIVSTKNLTGHCLGAAGAIEAAISWLEISSGRANAALSNSFAFGGSNAALAFTAWR